MGRFNFLLGFEQTTPTRTAFGGPKPPSHAHLNLFGGVEQFHFGSLRKHCWQEGRTPHLCCDPAFGPEGFSTCWTRELSFIECCTATTDTRSSPRR